jgi:hypothetical protein
VGTLLSSAPFCPRDVHRVALVRDWGPFTSVPASLVVHPAFYTSPGPGRKNPPVTCQSKLPKNSISLPTPDVGATVPARTRDHRRIAQRPGAPHHKFRVLVVDRHEVRRARLEVSVPPGGSSARFIHLGRARNLRTLCTSCHNLHSPEYPSNNYSTAPFAPHTRVLEALVGSFHRLVVP